jgi:hypothetical protein
MTEPLNIDRGMSMTEIAARVRALIPNLDADGREDVVINWGSVPGGDREQTVDSVLLLNVIATRIGVDNADRVAAFSELRDELAMLGADLERLDPKINTDVYSPTAPNVVTLPVTRERN